ncbi:helix-turn-helix domain-containing protein [Clostridium tunisiense]|nr:helix-turn-helix domain-containing protein [Clostridium tunisiense]
MLYERKLKAIECIIKCENITDTAKLVGVNRKSIYAWIDDK